MLFVTPRYSMAILGIHWQPQAGKKYILNDFGVLQQSPKDTPNHEKTISDARLSGNLCKKMETGKTSSRCSQSIDLGLAGSPGTTKRHPWVHFYQFWPRPVLTPMFAHNRQKKQKTLGVSSVGVLKPARYSNFCGRTALKP